MSSPQETTSDGTRKTHEQITFRFCSECSNMLYPKEDPDSHKLQFTCRTCQYTEEASSTCVFRNLMNNAVGETAGVTQDVGSDPTVSHTSPATRVKHNNPLEAGPSPDEPMACSASMREYIRVYHAAAAALERSDGPHDSSDLQDGDDDDDVEMTDIYEAVLTTVCHSLNECIAPDAREDLHKDYLRLVMRNFIATEATDNDSFSDLLPDADDADPPEAFEDPDNSAWDSSESGY